MKRSSTKRLVKTILSLAVFIVIAATVAGGILSYFREGRINSRLRFNSMSGMKYRIVFDSFDPDSRIVQAHAAVELYRDAAYFSDRAFFSSIGVSQLKDVRLLYGPLTLEDLGERVNDSGLLVAQFDENVYPSVPGSTYRDSFPLIARAELHALGDPSLFPFDTYLVVGKVWSDTFAEKKDTTKKPADGFVRLDLESLGIDVRLPGYFVRPALQSDLTLYQNGADGRTFNPEELAAYENGSQRITDQSQIWTRNRFAIVIERPLFLRALTIIVLLVAACSIIAIAMTTDSRQFAINSTSYFLALWAIRGVLEVGAPKSPTIVDYSVLCLYVTLVGLILAKLIRGPESS